MAQPRTTTPVLTRLARNPARLGAARAGRNARDRLDAERGRASRPHAA